MAAAYFLPPESALALICAKSPFSFSTVDRSVADLGAGSGKVARRGDQFFVRLARQLGESLLKVLGIGLQTTGTAFHLLLGGTDFESAYVLRARP